MSARQRSIALPAGAAMARRTSRSRCITGAAASWWASLLLAILLLAVPSRAAFVNFQNCLSPGIINADPPPLHLQFTPYNVTASINLTDPGHLLNITVYGDVRGQYDREPLPPLDNRTYWDDGNNTNGKIPSKNTQTNIYSTLFVYLDVLNYQAFAAPAQQFCTSLVGNHTKCPLGPVFPAPDPSNYMAFPAVTYAHEMQSTYGFTTISATLEALLGDKNKTEFFCAYVNITPYIGQVAQDLLTYLPLLILVLIAIATVSAAILSPWGTWDVFRATSNYKREVRLLRMMTPGFGDCLNYLQFIVLTGSLSLSYPGFFQPVVSNVAWSALMFNESFVTHGPGRPATVDGIYVANGTYGLDTMSQLVGMSDDQDLLAGMIVWLLVAIGAIILLIQIAFALRWLYRLVSRTQEEDLRAKNLPFSAGNTIRIVFNYFMVPLTAFAMFQLVIASSAPTPGVVVMAVLILAILIGFAGWLIWIIIDARPRSFLFDDLPTVLLYGPLYNTYSDSAAPFAVVTIIINFIRGVAIGALQPSGTAQIVLLAICEVVFLLTLNAYRPFFSGTFMNLINTLFSVARLIIILLMVVFVPNLGASDASKGYVAYIILILHALVLFAGFFIRVLSTLFELTARAAGAGEDSSAIGGFARVLGLRQLSRRDARDAARSRQSYASGATMLNHVAAVEKGSAVDGRSRSLSANSGQLLNGTGTRRSVTLESVSGFGGPSHSGSVVPPSLTGGAASSTSHRHGSTQAGVAGAATLAGLRSMEPADPYFRAPRPRRTMTNEGTEIEARDERNRNSWGSADWARAAGAEGVGGIDLGEPFSVSGHATPLGLASTRERTDSIDERLPKPDYATREVDYYYGVRGPALSHMPTRRLKTGPADPTGPVSSAAGWFMGLFGGKTKEKGKGFEVVRSARMPPQMEEEEKDPDSHTTPYDDPNGTEQPRHLDLGEEGGAMKGGTRRLPGESSRGTYTPMDGETFMRLPEIDAGESLQLPSRWGSKASSRPSRGQSRREADADAPPVPLLPLELEMEPVPEVPRRSSKRNSVFTNSQPGSTENVVAPPPADVPNWPLGTSSSGTHLSSAQRIPFGNTLSPPSTSGGNHNASRHLRNFSAGSEVSAVSAVSRTSEVSAMTSEYAEQRVAASNSGPALHNHRPSSLGYVQQHRASDGLRIVSGTEHSLTGSSAELVEPDSAGRRE